MVKTRESQGSSCESTGKYSKAASGSARTTFDDPGKIGDPTGYASVLGWIWITLISDRAFVSNGN